MSTSIFDTKENLVGLLFVVAALQIVELGTNSYLLPKWLTLYASVALLFLILTYKILNGWTFRLDALDAATLVLNFYVTTSLIWSPSPQGGAIQAINLAVLSVIFIYARRFKQENLVKILVLACILTCVVDLFRSHVAHGASSGFGNVNFQTEFFVATLPYVVLGCFFLKNYLRFFLVTLIVLTIAHLIFANPSRSEFIIWTGFCIVLLLVRIARSQLGNWVKLTANIGVAFLIGGIVYVVLANVQTLSFRKSVLPRIELNINTAMMWLDRPWFGRGFGSFDYTYTSFREKHLELFPELAYAAFETHFNIAGAAHNDYLQCLSELGAFGVCLILIVGAIAHRQFKSVKHSRKIVFASGSCVLLVGIDALINFPLQIPSIALVFALSLAILTSRNADGAFTALSPTKPDRPVLQRISGSVLVLLVAIGLTVFGFRSAIAGYHFGSNFQQFRESDPARAYAAIRDANAAMPWNETYRRQLFASLVGWMEADLQQAPNEIEAERAYLASLTTGPIQPGILLARIKYFMLREDLENEEIDHHFNTLNAKVKYLTAIPVMEARYALRINNLERAQRAHERAMAILPVYENSHGRAIGLRNRLDQLQRVIDKKAEERRLMQR